MFRGAQNVGKSNRVETMLRHKMSEGSERKHKLNYTLWKISEGVDERFKSFNLEIF